MGRCGALDDGPIDLVVDAASQLRVQHAAPPSRSAGHGVADRAHRGRGRRSSSARCGGPAGPTGARRRARPGPRRRARQPRSTGCSATATASSAARRRLHRPAVVAGVQRGRHRHRASARRCSLLAQRAARPAADAVIEEIVPGGAGRRARRPGRGDAHRAAPRRGRRPRRGGAVRVGGAAGHHAAADGGRGRRARGRRRPSRRGPRARGRPVGRRSPSSTPTTDVVVVDKPAGLVVHPGAGPRTRARSCTGCWPASRASRGVGEADRPGIVHRLDKGTSGLLVVARTAAAYDSLVAAAARPATVERALPGAGLGPRSRPPPGVVDAPIGRSERAIRTRMAVSSAGREARTRYEVLRRVRASPASLTLARVPAGDRPHAPDPGPPGGHRAPRGRRRDLRRRTRAVRARPAVPARRAAWPSTIPSAGEPLSLR